MAETTTVDTTSATTTTDPTVGQQTGMESSLSNWAGDYVTDMLGRGWAMADEGYQNYEGPLSAGESALQQQAFSGLAGLTVPDATATSFTPGTYTDPANYNAYMNPYVQTALQPTLDEITRQGLMQQQRDNAQLTQAGAYGGSRQALMNAENNRNMLDQMARTYAEGMSQAYQQGANQFNTEQGLGLQAAQNAQQYGLSGLAAQLQAGMAQRDVEQQGYTADYEQFQEERDFPYKQVQYMQSLLQGLPLAAQSYSYSQPSGISQLLGGISGGTDLYQQILGSNGLFPDLLGDVGSWLEQQWTGNDPATGYTDANGNWVTYDLAQD